MHRQHFKIFFKKPITVPVFTVIRPQSTTNYTDKIISRPRDLSHSISSIWARTSHCAAPVNYGRAAEGAIWAIMRAPLHYTYNARRLDTRAARNFEVIRILFRNERSRRGAALYLVLEALNITRENVARATRGNVGSNDFH